jgi:hypothetical protein
MASLNSYNGTATPYLALFDEQTNPIMNTQTGIPLGAYISKFSYKYDEDKENLATLTFDTGDPDTVNIDELQVGKTIYLQWGYIFPDGTFHCVKPKAIKIRDYNCVFDNTGTHSTIKCVDGVNSLRYLPGHAPNAPEDDDDGVSSMVDFMDRGCDANIGIIIEKFD